MPSPREVFDNPVAHWTLITSSNDSEFENQFFDRKEAPRAGNSGFARTDELKRFIEEKVVETISAFTNENRDGGLLVLGVAKNGDVKGLSHLNDEQQQMLASLNNRLRGHSTRTRSHECTGADGKPTFVLLMLACYNAHGFCETNDSASRFWVRRHNRNMEGDDRLRDQLRYEKRVVSFESEWCCPFMPTEVDQGVLREFRHSYSQDAQETAQPDDEFLYNVGALRVDGDSYAFNRAGALFFLSNPQRVMPSAHLRLLRFQVSVQEIDSRGAQTADKKFTGPVTKQIRDARNFFKESMFFRTLPQRNAEGGLTDEPEYPFDAVDEAIVNAVAHRDYSVPLPIECEAYSDAFRVINPGRILQREHSVPDSFSLDTFTLKHAPRNEKLLDWLKAMRGDERGNPFIKAVAEGTKTMRREMERLGLPAPLYNTGDSQTIVNLFNNERQRISLLRFASPTAAVEFSNLFSLDVDQDPDWAGEGGGVTEDGQPLPQPSLPGNGVVLEAIRSRLLRNNWYVHSHRFSRLVTGRKDWRIRVPDAVAQVMRFFPAYAVGVREHWGSYYLCIDYAPKIRNLLTITELMAYLSKEELSRGAARAQSGRWRRCRVLEAGDDWTQVRFEDSSQEEQVRSDKVVPELPLRLLQKVLEARGVSYDLSRAVKEHSLSLRPGTARTRWEKIQAAASDLREVAFPLSVGAHRFEMASNPAPLRRRGAPEEAFQMRVLPEPTVAFFRNQETPDIRDGITRLGSFEHDRKDIEIVPVTLPPHRQAMQSLIERLQVGKLKFRGVERTFGARFTYGSVITASHPDHILNECRRLLNERPEWRGDPALNRLFLVHTPEHGYSSDDENSPYFTVKRFLLENGIPCQMVDTPTLSNPDFKDLNLALNMTAKCGVTPWVLPGGMADSDFFIGLSYTHNTRRGDERLMGYANVFNHYGRWEFYRGNTQAFSYDQRTHYFGELASETLRRLEDEGKLSETPNIWFHYSAKFSWEDRLAIVRAARGIRPQGTYNFVSINTHHDVRLFDSRPETDGSLSRGAYVLASPSRIFLSTTGHNPYRKALGTPQMLEITTWSYPREGVPPMPPDLRVLALQVLSLTKLNWASTESLCGEPITIKFAGDVAYLTAAFLRQNASFQLHPVLENTPWFI